jgi:hypothetical protein
MFSISHPLPSEEAGKGKEKKCLLKKKNDPFLM